MDRLAASVGTKKNATVVFNKMKELNLIEYVNEGDDSLIRGLYLDNTNINNTEDPDEVPF